MQIHITELGNHEVKDVGFAHLFDFVFKLEEFENLAHVGRETFNVADEVFFNFSICRRD